MGVSTDAILAYGWDLGDAYDIEERIEIDEEFGGLIDNVERILLAKIGGFTDRWDETKKWDTPAGKDYYARKREAENKIKVELIHHCSDEEVMYFLAIGESYVSARRGYPEKLSTNVLIIERDWDGLLYEAADILGIKKEIPSWYLFSWWG